MQGVWMGLNFDAPPENINGSSWRWKKIVEVTSAC